MSFDDWIVLFIFLLISFKVSLKKGDPLSRILTAQLASFCSLNRAANRSAGDV